MTQIDSALQLKTMLHNFYFSNDDKLKIYPETLGRKFDYNTRVFIKYHASKLSMKVFQQRDIYTSKPFYIVIKDDQTKYEHLIDTIANSGPDVARLDWRKLSFASSVNAYRSLLELIAKYGYGDILGVTKSGEDVFIYRKIQEYYNYV